MRKNRLVAAVALVLPLLVTVGESAQTNYRISWDPYPHPEATIIAECQVGVETSFTERGSVSAAQNSVIVQMDTNPGNIIQCRAKARWGDQESLPSGVASYTVPFPPLNPPAGVTIRESLVVPGAL